MEPAVLQYFVDPGPTSDVGRHCEQIETFASAPAALGEVVRGILLHNFTAEMNGIASSDERDGMRTFGASATIDRILELDAAPLDQARPQQERLIGYCYHFALLHCAFLRVNGVPARTRCGFANYLIPDKWTDHWVVEHWDGEQWLLNDPQIGLDSLSHDDFRNGAQAWQLCRSGEANPGDHGNGELWGWDELRGSLVNDIGALNKIEIGDWDWCELLQVEPLDQPDQAVDTHLDRVAAVARSGSSLAELHELFAADATIRPPDKIIGKASLN